MSFADLGLSNTLLQAVADAGYNTPTPIQAEAIPQVLRGRDILGCAQTGTGKTASFTLPMIDILDHGRAKAMMPRSLILEPTRELAAQVAENFETYGKHHKLTKALLIGGESMDQQKAVLSRGVDVLIATPGRMIDMFERGTLLLNDVKILVIDEADRMLDMGFIPDVERIVSMIPRMRQTLFFSATMPPAIRRLADAFLMNPKAITVAPPASTADTVTQAYTRVKSVGSGRGRGDNVHKAKRETLRRMLNSFEVKNALVFCNRKRDVGIVCRSLQRHGFNAGQLHGNMSQPARMETLENFKAGGITLLVCSDVAARGIDISDLSHVFNYDIPTHAEDYVHRIGRTARAGKKGHAFTLVADEDRKYLSAIENLIKLKINEYRVGDEMPTEAGAKAAAPAETPTAPETTEKPRRTRSRRSAGKETAAVEAATPPPAIEAPAQPVETPAPVAEADAPADNTAVAARDTSGGNGTNGGGSDNQNRRSRKSEGRRPAGKKFRMTDDDKPIVGMGDHVPAFLLRPVVISGKK